MTVRKDKTDMDIDAFMEQAERDFDRALLDAEEYAHFYGLIGCKITRIKLSFTDLELSKAPGAEKWLKEVEDIVNRNLERRVTLHQKGGDATDVLKDVKRS